MPDDNSYGVDHPAGTNKEFWTWAGAWKTLTPEQLEIEFGVKLAGDAGALIAKGTSDAHFVLRMSWTAGAAALHGEETLHDR